MPVKKRGGARPGAGRKPLSQTIKKVDPAVINAGILPLEMRLKVARKMWAEAINETGEIADIDKAKAAADFAEAALPYTSNRLATMIHTGPNGGAIEHNHRHEAIDDVRAIIAEESKVPASKHTRH